MITKLLWKKVHKLEKLGNEVCW